MSLINILIAEDDPEDRTLLIEAFDEIGISSMVKMCNNGQEIFHYLDGLSDPDLFPGLIILDAAMPVMDGLETITALKENHRYHFIPVVILSASENAGLRYKFIDKGARSYVIKPHSYDANLAQYLYELLRFASSEIEINVLVSG